MRRIEQTSCMAASWICASLRCHRSKRKYRYSVGICKNLGSDLFRHAPQNVGGRCAESVAGDVKIETFDWREIFVAKESLYAQIRFLYYPVPVPP